MFPRDLENFQGWEYGAGGPKVQEHQKVKISYLRYLNLFESFIFYLGQVVKAMKPFCQKCKSCIEKVVKCNIEKVANNTKMM